MTDSARFSWTVLLPVKVLARAKSRLAVLAGDRRRELALALASDTVAAVLACPEVARVVVVTSDPGGGAAARGARRGHRPRRAGGPPRPASAHRGPLDRRGCRGSARAISACRTRSTRRCGTARRWRRGAGRDRARGAHRRPARAEPRRAGGGAARRGRPAGPAAFVPDAAGVGTTLYAVPPGGEFRPLFGGASRARHAAAGAAELDLDGMTGLRRDVDTPDDLREALALGAGRAPARWRPTLHRRLAARSAPPGRSASA